MIDPDAKPMNLEAARQIIAELRSALDDMAINVGKGKDYSDRLLTCMAKRYGAQCACETLREKLSESEKTQHEMVDYEVNLRAKIAALEFERDMALARVAELEHENQKLRTDLAMHPSGRCTCAGSGECLWCQLIDANDLCNKKDDRIAEMERERAKLRDEVERLRASLQHIAEQDEGTARIQNLCIGAIEGKDPKE